MTRGDDRSLFENPRLVEAGDIRLAVYEQQPEGDQSGPPLVLMHGFPETAFSWRHQVPVLAASGRRTIAYDGRGYGFSDAPEGIEAYHMEKLTGDFEGLLDTLGIEKAIAVGHDWGALTMWALPFYCPERVAGLVALNVPFRMRSPADPIETMNATYGPQNYINFFQAPGPAEALWQADIARTIRFFYRRPDAARAGEALTGTGRSDTGLPKLDFQTLFERPEAEWPGACFLSDDELDYYIAAFERSGFAGPLNWYRNFSPNWHDMLRFQPDGSAPPVIDLPTLMVLAEKDPVLPPALAESMDVHFSDLETYLVKDSGHWTQQEKPAEVSRVLIDWLDRRFGV